MRRPLSVLLVALTLSSCGTIQDTVDHTAERTERLVDHTTQQLNQLKTETLKEVKETIEYVMPNIIETILNNEAVAFVIVSITCLLGLVVVVALVFILGLIRALWKRLSSK